MNSLVIGDSLSVQTKDENCYSWIDIVKSKSDVNIYSQINHKGGCEEIINNLDDYIENYKPKTIFIALGSQDALSNKTANHIYTTVTQIINECTTKGITAIVILQPLFNTELCSLHLKRDIDDLNNSLITLKRYRRLIEDYCYEENIGTIDFQKAFKETDFKVIPEKYYTDGIHLTEYAHNKIAEKFLYKYNHILVQETSKNNFTNIQINTVKGK